MSECAPKKITGTTRVFGVIADPVDHVAAPSIYNPVVAERGIDAIVVPYHVPPENLGAALKGLAAMPNCGGVFVTIPHKVAAAGLCDEIGPGAEAAGAVNVIRFDNGRLLGENFDGVGFVAGLEGEGIPPKGSRVLMIGAGGAARAIALALAESGVERLTVANRTASKGEELVKILAQNSHGIPVDVIGLDAAEEALPSADLVVNTTSLGLKDGDALPCGLNGAGQQAIVADIIMVPAVTAWMKEAESLGLRTHPGRHMLEYQREPMGRFIGIFGG